MQPLYVSVAGTPPDLMQKAEETLIALREAGLAILLVEQNLRSALAVADAVHVLETGKMVWTGTAQALSGRDGSGRVVDSGAYIAKIRQKDGKLIYQTLVVVK